MANCLYIYIKLSNINLIIDNNITDMQEMQFLCLHLLIGTIMSSSIVFVMQNFT